MTAHGSPAGQELVVLQTIRLAGVADTHGLSDRLDGIDLLDVIPPLLESGLVERMSFADFGGWVLTAAGQTRLAGLLHAQATASPEIERLLGSTADAFEEINAPFVEAVSAWQLDSTASGTGPGELLVFLTRMETALHDVLAELIRALPRFSRYPRQFERALTRARADSPQHIAGVGILSCHTVWAELHQDILSSLGRERAARSQS